MVASDFYHSPLTYSPLTQRVTWPFRPRVDHKARDSAPGGFASWDRPEGRSAALRSPQVLLPVAELRVFSPCRLGSGFACTPRIGKPTSIRLPYRAACERWPSP